MKKILDGIVDIDKYNTAKYKVLWILKEGNVDPADKDIDRDIRLEILKNQHKENACAIPTFRKIIYSTYGILYPDIDWLDIPPANKDSYEILKKIAYININKFPGDSVSSDALIRDSYRKNKTELLSQISDIAPNIIIFGGTSQYFPEEDLQTIGWDATQTSRFVVKDPESDNEITCYSNSKKKLIICAYHPAYFGISDFDYYSVIREAVIVWEKRNTKTLK